MLGSFNLSRLIFLRMLAALYFVAFLVALKQFPELLGQNGLLPIPQFIQQVPFHEAPSLFYLTYSDRLLQGICLTGMGISAGLLLGLLDRGPWWCTTGLWLILWAFYLSIVNVGQTFYSFGWESMLLEAGFFAAFLGPRLAPSLIPILILRWMLFRVELGAGLIKLRGDECWRDFTCLYYHHETQPMPNPLSWYFHHLPPSVHRFGVGFSQFVQLIAPFGLFAPSLIAAVCASLIIFHQLMLIASGNYSWLNWLTVALAFSAFSDSVFRPFFPRPIPQAPPRPMIFKGILYGLAFATLLLSIPPALNFFAKRQLMNFNYNRFHLVGSYGAFGSVTQERYEIVVEGTESPDLQPGALWREYEFKGKPGNILHNPPQYAPYHLRLDWLMWFLPFSMRVTDHEVLTHGYPLWFLRFVQKLLEGDPKIHALLRNNPFLEHPPRFLRAKVWLYHFTSPEERKRTGAVWKREPIGDYLPPVNLDHLRKI
ncbi:MAG: lipase maturation factor family protein [Candidatus Omnitrophica bacterium]|nr:lipase maturation factor family protein [Candidatus Omnitrophota bacterium]